MVAILEPEAISAVRLTVDEYLEAELPEGYHYELVDGVVQMSPNPGLPHEKAVFRLAQVLFRYQESHSDQIALITFAATVPIPGRARVREPDIAVYRTSEESPVSRPSAFWKTHSPLLVAEVISPDQHERDYVDKRQDYWKTSIEEYWIVHLEQGELTVLTRGSADWRERRYRPAERFPAACLPGLTVDISSIIRP